MNEVWNIEWILCSRTAGMLLAYCWGLKVVWLFILKNVYIFYVKRDIDNLTTVESHLVELEREFSVSGNPENYIQNNLRVPNRFYLIIWCVRIISINDFWVC